MAPSGAGGAKSATCSVAVGVGGPDGDRVVAGGRGPVEPPLPPGVRADRSRPAGPAATGRRRSAPRPWRCRCAGPRPPRPRRPCPASSVAPRRHVDPGGDLDRAAGRPAERGPVALVGGEGGHLELGHPLGRRDVAVQAGDDHPYREAVLDRQRRAVHPDGQQRLAVGVGQHVQRRARGPAVVAGGQHHVGARLRPGLGQQLADRVAQPEGVAGQVAADLVGHAGQRGQVLDQRLGGQRRRSRG